MGLGKTVEVIACILCHRKPSSEHKVLDNTVAADQYLNVSKPSTAASVTKLNVQECSKMQPTECDGCYQEDTDRNADKPDCSCDKIDSDPTDVSCNQGSSCFKTALTLCNDNSDSDTVTVTGDDTSFVCQSENFVTELQGHEQTTRSATATAVEEHISVVKCQCICGINVASSDDKLLECCSCQAVFHAECLQFQYDCPGKFLCPHCTVNQVRIHSSGHLVEQKQSQLINRSHMLP